VLIGQLSDPHVRPWGTLYQGVVDSNRMLSEAISHLLQGDRCPDLVLVTGDLVDQGEPAEYAVARELLDGMGIPYLVIPGNHDERENFRIAFSDLGYLPSSGPLHYCVDEHPVRFVGLDSCVPGLHHGHIDAEGLEWLSTVLQEGRSRPTVVMLHHPPFSCGIPYMDKYRYLDPRPLEAVLAGFDHIEAVLCGHVHRTMLRRWAKTVVCACPSTVTEIDLQLQPDAEPSSHVGPRGCMLHLWNPQHGLISHACSIGTFAGPYPFA
jgi:3',5'-cyclic-AMP phosphodiesterase